MPGNFGSSDSKWSSERERKERERQREAQKELMRQARLEREAKEAKEAEERAAREAREAADREAIANAAGDRGEGIGPRRNLSEEERQAIRRLRGQVPEGDEETGGASTGESSARSGGGRGVGRRWRSQVEGAASGGQPALPDLPGDESGNRTRGRNLPSTRLIIFGAVLFLVMAAMAFAPFGPLGGGGGKPTPTPSPTAVIPETSTLPSINGTPQKQPTAPRDNQEVVCIDPGHGGWDYGYQRTWQDGTPQGPPLNESELNLGMAYMLKERLESEGITVVMTRTGGEAVNIYGEDVNGDGRTIFDGGDDAARKQNGDWDEIQARINVCNDAHADIMISLHLNGTRELPDARGYEVYFTTYPTRPFGQLSQQLAESVYRRMFQAMNDAGYTGQARGPKDDSELEADKYTYGAAEHLLLTGPAVDKPDRKLVPSNMPGIICEPIFLSNEDDANFIADPKNQQLLVDAYADGILDYFKKNPG
ncbi:MAG: N-acetylmuramoyl-L-alanine amidase [Thermomicrobiales bacterium]